jgi:succinate-semialdehyde dehydrogenase/glutarate-semialdehyde dehydrogenase
MYQSINPYTQELFARYPKANSETIENVVAQSNIARSSWKLLSIREKGKRLLALAKRIEEEHLRLAELATLEMGKTYTEAKLEVLKCISACEYYAKYSESILQTVETLHSDGRKVYSKFEPLGTILGVFPWNFPYWQIIRSTIPIIMSGNTMIIKPAPNTPQCALALQGLLDEIGLGNGIVQTLFIDNEQIQSIISDNRISACTLTGSEMAGSAVASQAAKHIKKSVLELGGSDPFIVLADADLNLVMKHATSARFQNNGQSCIASKRYIIADSIYDEFIERLVIEVKKLKIGNPMDEGINIGPMARIDLKEKLAFQVKESVKLGANIKFQSEFKHDQTCFYPPTILESIPPHCSAYRDELFGPVLSVFCVKSIQEAISLANDTSFGLGATIWSSDLKKAEMIANQIEAGQVFINAVTRSHTAFPFGGIKKSGFGREMGNQGLLEFCSIKTIWI